jgi:uncharacterized membrane protein YhaH (DUF805 family)
VAIDCAMGANVDLLFGFSGRIGRGQWWLAQLAILVVIIVFVGIIAAVAQPSASDGLGNAGMGVVLLIGAAVVLMVWINIACTVKRFHDRDKSGYWFLIVFVPYIGSIWQIVECGFLAGSAGINNYGPPSGSGGSSVYGDLADDMAAYAKPQQRQAPAAKTVMAAPAPATLPRQPSPSRFGRRGIS